MDHAATDRRPDHGAHTPSEDDPRRGWWMGWAGVWILAAGLLAARLAYHLWLSPFELAADEAHYWDWSRHLSLSYYSKGPGVAWAIWASTQLFGHAEWAVRLPAAVSAMVTTLVLARLAQRCAGGDARAAFLAAAAFSLVPGFQATALLMTIDMPYVACWSLAALAAWEMLSAQREGRAGLGWAALLGLAIGVGFLFKYTILLLLPGLLAFRLLRPTRVDRRRGLPASAACAFVALAAVQPVLIWNHQHGWPTVAHLLGHLDLPGGDVPREPGEPNPWSPLWALEFIGAQIGLVGPMIVLMAGGAWRALRRWRERGSDAEADVFLACCGVPIVLIYVGVSLMTDAEANWAIAGYTTLCVLVARRALVELPRYRAMVRAWRAIDPPRPKRGILRRKPETGWQIAWHWSIGYGVVAGVGMLGLVLLERVPVVAEIVPSHRLMGHAARAERLAGSLREVHAERTGEALVMAHRYTDASRMAYHLFRIMGEEAPTVTSGSAHLGERASAYDHWPETDPADPRWLGATVHLVGGGIPKWQRGFAFERVVPLESRPALSLGFGYGGPAERSTP